MINNWLVIYFIPVNINNTNKMSLNNLKINKYEIKTEELDVLHNLDFYASSIKEEPEDFNDSATSKSE